MAFSFYLPLLLLHADLPFCSQYLFCCPVNNYSTLAENNAADAQLQLSADVEVEKNTKLPGTRRRERETRRRLKKCLHSIHFYRFYIPNPQVSYQVVGVAHHRSAAAATYRETIDCTGKKKKIKLFVPKNNNNGRYGLLVKAGRVRTAKPMDTSICIP